MKKAKGMADTRSDFSDDMAKERNPTYSNIYDAKVRTVSEYENPYDVSRRETFAPGQQNAADNIPLE